MFEPLAIEPRYYSIAHLLETIHKHSVELADSFGTMSSVDVNPKVFANILGHFEKMMRYSSTTSKKTAELNIQCPTGPVIIRSNPKLHETEAIIYSDQRTVIIDISSDRPVGDEGTVVISRTERAMRGDWGRAYGVYTDDPTLPPEPEPTFMELLQKL